MAFTCCQEFSMCKKKCKEQDEHAKHFVHFKIYCRHLLMDVYILDDEKMSMLRDINELTKTNESL